MSGSKWSRNYVDHDKMLETKNMHTRTVLIYSGHNQAGPDELLKNASC